MIESNNNAAGQPRSRPLTAVVLISGNGSNLQAIIDAIKNENLPLEIRAVISNQASAFGLQRAKNAGIHTEILNHKDFPTRESFDQALQNLIDDFSPQLIILAGFMRILSSAFVKHYEGRMINIHPSLLPQFRGLNTHQRAIDAKVSIHGATVHYVTPEVDDGPLIIQAQVPLSPHDTAKTLMARVLAAEHRIYPIAIRWIAEGRLRWKDGELFFDGDLLKQPKIYANRQTS